MYFIVGADQKEYGPITEEQLAQWIQEGRANGQTLARAEGGPWKPLSAFPEFATQLPPEPAGFVPPEPSGAPPPAPAWSGGGMVGGEAPRTHGLAIAGLVCGIIGLFCCGPIFAILALAFSLIALNQIKEKPELYTGHGLAIAGLVLAGIDLLVFILSLVIGLQHFRWDFRDF